MREKQEQRFSRVFSPIEVEKVTQAGGGGVVVRLEVRGGVGFR